MPKKCLKCLKSAKNATFLAFKAYNSITVGPSWGKNIWGRHISSTLQDSKSSIVGQVAKNAQKMPKVPIFWNLRPITNKL